MATSEGQDLPDGQQPGNAGGLSRRGVLKGAAVTAGSVVLGLGAAGAAEAADAAITATSPDGKNKITMSLVGGVLQWSARRNGTAVADPSVLGLQLSDGTTLGQGNTTVTRYQHWTRDSTWTPPSAATRPYGTTIRRCAGTSWTAPAA